MALRYTLLGGLGGAVLGYAYLNTRAADMSLATTSATGTMITAISPHAFIGGAVACFLVQALLDV